MGEKEYLKNKSFKHKALAVAATTVMSCALFTGCGGVKVDGVSPEEGKITPIILEFNGEYYAFNMTEMKEGFNNGHSYVIKTEEDYTIKIETNGVCILSNPDGEVLGMDSNAVVIMKDLSEIEQLKVDDSQMSSIVFDYNIQEDDIIVEQDVLR